MSRRIALIAAAMALAAAACGPSEAPKSPAAAPDLRADSRDLKDTLVVASDRARVPEGKNVLWCASFQLAWDAFRRDLLGGAPLALGPPAPADEVAALNAETLPPGDLDPAAFVAMAGHGRDRVFERFQDAARAKFGDDAGDLERPAFHPDNPAVFAMLMKDLPFEHRFEDYRVGIRFAGGGRTVRAFGMNHSSGNQDRDAILGQVRVHMAEGPSPRERPERFIVELSVRGGRDRLLLARIDAAATLRETWERVRDAAGGQGEPVESDTVFAVPKLDFDVTHRFAELEGEPAGLVASFQRTKLRLDETGAHLSSYAAIEQKAAIDPCFLFDGPFLLALVQKGATRPYLLLWVGNDELLLSQ